MNKKKTLIIGGIIALLFAIITPTTIVLVNNSNKSEEEHKEVHVTDLSQDIVKFIDATSSKTESTLKHDITGVGVTTKEILGYTEPTGLTSGVHAIYSVAHAYTSGDVDVHVRLTKGSELVSHNTADFHLTPKAQPISYPAELQKIEAAPKTLKTQSELKAVIDDKDNTPITSEALGIPAPATPLALGLSISYDGTYDGTSPTATLTAKLENPEDPYATGNTKEITITPRDENSLGLFGDELGSTQVSTKLATVLATDLGTKTTVTAAELGLVEPATWVANGISATYSISAYSGTGPISVSYTLSKTGISAPTHNTGTFTLNPGVPLSLATEIANVEAVMTDGVYIDPLDQMAGITTGTPMKTYVSTKTMAQLTGVSPMTFETLGIEGVILGDGVTATLDYYSDPVMGKDDITMSEARIVVTLHKDSSTGLVDNELTFLLKPGTPATIASHEGESLGQYTNSAAHYIVKDLNVLTKQDSFKWLFSDYKHERDLTPADLGFPDWDSTLIDWEHHPLPDDVTIQKVTLASRPSPYTPIYGGGHGLSFNIKVYLQKDGVTNPLSNVAVVTVHPAE